MERNEWQRLEKELDELINDLQAKCNKYEVALNGLKSYSINCLKYLANLDPVIIVNRIDEALSVEGETKAGMPPLTEPIISEEDLKAYEGEKEVENE